MKIRRVVALSIVAGIAAVMGFMACSNMPVTYEAHNLFPFVPEEVHYRVYTYVRTCLGESITSDVPFDSILWWEADSIIASDQSDKVIGLTRYPDNILLDTRWRNNPGLLSHEFVHLLAPQFAHGSDEFKECLMPYTIR